MAIEWLAYLPAIKSALGGMLLKKGTDALWGRLVKYFKPDALRVAIESALNADPHIADVCRPAPVFNRDRFQPEHVSQLLQKAISDDVQALGEYLVAEQLIELPAYPEKKPESYEVVWQCIAAAIIRAVWATVPKDETLARSLQQSAAQLSHEQQEQLLVAAAELQTTVMELREKIETLPEIVASEVVERLSHEGSVPTRALSLLAADNDKLEQALREQLDAETQRQWDEMLAEVERHNFSLAVQRARKLHEWLQAKGAHLSSVARARALLHLAQIALIDASEWGTSSDRFSTCRQFLESARQAFGAHPEVDDELRLLTVDAKLLAIDGRIQEAIDLLGERTDPRSLTTRLLIHIDSEQIDLAASIIRGVSLHEKWCDHATFIQAANGEPGEAHATLEWSENTQDRSVVERCWVAFARGTLTRLATENGKSGLFPLLLTENDRERLLNVITVLSPLIDLVRARQEVTTGIEADAVAFASMCYRLLGRVEEARSCLTTLQKRRPVHLELIRAVLRGDAVGADDLPGQIRTDYPNWFTALDMALIVDEQRGASIDDVICGVERIAPLAVSETDKERCVRTLIQVVAVSAGESNVRALNVAAAVIGEQHKLVDILRAAAHLACREDAECERCLDSNGNSYPEVVDQLRAQLCARRGRLDLAAELMLQAGRKMSDPALLREASRLAYAATPQRLDIVIQALEDAIRVDPTDAVAHHNLAVAYIEVQAFANAAELFGRLRELRPTDVQYALRQAHCLALAHHRQGALDILRDICRMPAASLEVQLLYAELLHAEGEPASAFATLQSVRTVHWEQPAFVVNYMLLAHAANQDGLAQEAFEQLWNLRQQGKAPPEILQPHSIDDLVKFATEARERRQLLLGQQITGKLPWLFVEKLLHNVPYWGWRIRTEPQTWILDDPHTRASYSIYSTNSYGAPVNPDGRRSLRRLACSPKGSPVVADLSALLTLHRLGLLNQALDYCGKVVLPPRCFREVLQQSTQLQPHQLSQKSNLDQVLAAVTRQAIHVLPEGSDALVSSSVVDEYPADEAPLAFRLIDVLEALRRGGRLTSEMVDAKRVTDRRPSAAPLIGKELGLSDEVIIGLATLRDMASIQVLDASCDSFRRVSISQSDFQKLTQEVQGFALLRETQEWHEHLWKLLREDPRIDRTVFLRPRPRVESDTTDLNPDDDDSPHPIELEAGLLATQEGLPFLADDRVLQNMLIQSRPADGPPVFGTDALLVGLLRAGMIDAITAARSFLQLIKWRYRFLIIPPALLRTIALEFAPIERRALAAYLHDCMRDLGLFGGLEQTDPPISIAFRFFQDWLQSIAIFIAEIWTDETISESQAQELTDWATSELVPNVPLALGNHVAPLAEHLAFTLLGYALSRLFATFNHERANGALRQIERGLGLDDPSFSRLLADLADDYATT